MARWVKGVDASYSEMTDAEAKRLRADGVEVFVQALWAATETPPVAQWNLEIAIDNGFIVAGYISVNGLHSGAWHADQGRRAVWSHTWDKLALVFVDVELRGIPNQIIRDALDRVAYYGKRPAIYTSYNCWVNYQGNPTIFTDALLWNAYWDRHEDFSYPRLRYGGWGDDQVVGEQWSGAIEMHGVLVDRDRFNLDLLEVKPMPNGTTSLERFIAIEAAARRGRLNPGIARVQIALLIGEHCDRLLYGLGEGDIWETLPVPALTEQEERDFQAAVIRMARNGEYQDLVNAVKACKGIEATV